MIVVGSSAFQTSLLNLLFLCSDLCFELLNFLVELVHEVRHDGVLFVETQEHIEELLAATLDTGIADAHFLLDAIEGTTNFCFLL